MSSLEYSRDDCGSRSRNVGDISSIWRIDVMINPSYIYGGWCTVIRHFGAADGTEDAYGTMRLQQTNMTVMFMALASCLSEMAASRVQSTQSPPTPAYSESAFGDCRYDRVSAHQRTLRCSTRIFVKTTIAVMLFLFATKRAEFFRRQARD